MTDAPPTEETSDDIKKLIVENAGIEDEVVETPPQDPPQDPPPADPPQDPPPADPPQDPPPADPPADIDLEKETDPAKLKEHAYQQRKRLQAEKEARETAEREAREAREAAETKPTKTPEQLAQENEQVFAILERALRAESGEIVDGIEDAEKAAELKRLAAAAIAEMSPDNIVDIALKAEKGGFGEASASILAETQKHLPLAREREGRAQAKEAKQAEAVKAVQAQQAAAMQKVYDKHPKLREDGQMGEDGKKRPLSPEFTFVKDYLAEKVGTREKPGPFFMVAHSSIEGGPQLVEMAMKEFELSKLRGSDQKAQALKMRLETINGPDSGGHPSGKGTPAAKESDQIKAQLVERAGITEEALY